MPARLLIVDDDKHIRHNLERFFARREELDVVTVSTGSEAIDLASTAVFDAVLLDLQLPDISGLQVLEEIKANSPLTGVVIITGHADVGTAVKAMQMRADHYLMKPLDHSALGVIVDRLLEDAATRSKVIVLEGIVSRLTQKPQRFRFPSDVADSIQLLAQNADTTALLLGETGTGKGVAAALIHERSSRASRQFVDINCAGLNPELLESELFGHQRGAFTDARTSKPGLLEIANGGTLFLDEIGEMPPLVQAKLLKVLEDKTFRRLGGTRNIHVDVRIIAATNADLEKRVEASSFRKDLFFRLNILPLSLPPLRGRANDIVALAHDFLHEYATSRGKLIESFSPNALALLASYAWPGNIRELRNIVERAVLLCLETTVRACHLPQALIGAHTIPVEHLAPQDLSLESVERAHIAEVLEFLHGNRSATARALGIHRTTLIAKIKKYRL